MTRSTSGNHNDDKEWSSASPVARVDDDTTTTRASFVALVRITKSGSTALLQRLRSNPTFHRSLDLDSYYQHVGGGSRLSTRGLLPSCVFGIKTAPQDSGSSPSHMLRTNQSDHEALPYNSTTISPCPHTGYRNIVRSWTRGLEHLREDSHSVSTASLQVFTMVRDPTARYVSYFHYWRRTYPHWKDLATPVEREHLVRGDVEGFVHLQSNYPARTLNSASQHMYFNSDVDTAVTMVQELPLRVLPLVHECFETSLELLSVLFPTLSIVPHTTTPNSTSPPVDAPSQELPETAMFDEIQSYSMDELRHQARKWLVSEYRFYDAAVEQFRLLLRNYGTKLDPSRVLECNRRLDGRGAV